MGPQPNTPPPHISKLSAGIRSWRRSRGAKPYRAGSYRQTWASPGRPGKHLCFNKNPKPPRAQPRIQYRKTQAGSYRPGGSYAASGRITSADCRGDHYPYSKSPSRRLMGSWRGSLQLPVFVNACLIICLRKNPFICILLAVQYLENPRCNR